jgi:hypothetical protein
VRSEKGKVQPESSHHRSSKRLGNTFGRLTRPLVHDIFHLTCLLAAGISPRHHRKGDIEALLLHALARCVAPLRAKVWLGISVMADTRALV